MLWMLGGCKACKEDIQYIPRNMHTVFALLCFVVVIHWLIFPYPSGLLHWHCGNLTIAPVPAKQPWWIWINTSCEIIMNDCITTTKQSTTKPCAYFLGYTVYHLGLTLIEASMNNYIHYTVWYELTDPFVTFNGAVVNGSMILYHTLLATLLPIKMNRVDKKNPSFTFSIRDVWNQHENLGFWSWNINE